MVDAWEVGPFVWFLTPDACELGLYAWFPTPDACDKEELRLFA